MTREIVVPGEVISSEKGMLPGDGTEKRGDEIVAIRFGLAETQDRLIKVLPLSGPYNPRRGNVVIGKIIMITHNGWVVDIGLSGNAFLQVSEIPRFVSKDAMEEVLDIGDLVVGKIISTDRRGYDLGLKGRGFGKVFEGIVVEVNPSKVPRVIGKEGSMVNLIKENTDTNITVGQNGYIWIKGKEIESELLAQRAVEFIAENAHIEGLTDAVTKWFSENKK